MFNGNPTRLSVGGQQETAQAPVRILGPLDGSNTLDEELGPKLQKAKRTVEVIVIDQMETFHFSGHHHVMIDVV